MTLPKRLALATGNPGKVHEWRALLPDLDLVVLDLPSPDEDAPTYQGNAALKARAAAAATGLPALGDDVGLEVDALDGAPGLETKRWAEARGGWAPAGAELVAAAEGSGATYRCGLALVWPGGREITVTGSVRGLIGPRRGDGPGFEPWFHPDEPGAHHRRRALTALLRAS